MNEGHNSNALLKAITERINRLEDDKKQAAEGISDVYTEAKSNGLDPKALRVVIRRQRTTDKAKLAEHEAQVDLYLAALGQV